MQLTEFFNAGFYINLDRRIDRNILFQNMIKEENLQDFFKRVSAVDGILELDPMERHKYCSRSYYKVFKEAYEAGHERVVIFEDDAYFYNGWDIPAIKIIENAIDEIQQFPDWDLLYFGGCPHAPLVKVSETLYKCNTILATHAIGYTRKIIKFMLDNFNPDADCAIDGYYGNNFKISKYIVTPIAVPQRAITSDLDAHGYIVQLHDYLNCYEKNTPK